MVTQEIYFRGGKKLCSCYEKSASLEKESKDYFEKVIEVKWKQIVYINCRFNGTAYIVSKCRQTVHDVDVIYIYILDDCILQEY